MRAAFLSPTKSSTRASAFADALIKAATSQQHKQAEKLKTKTHEPVFQLSSAVSQNLNTPRTHCYLRATCHAVNFCRECLLVPHNFTHNR